MFYERLGEQEQIKEKEIDSEIEEISVNNSSEELQQITDNNDNIHNSSTKNENYPKKEINNNKIKNNTKEYFSPYISKSNLDYKMQNENKENNYLDANKNKVKYVQKNLVYNENIVRKNETEVNSYLTEVNDKIVSYPQNNTMGKYEIKEANNNQKLTNKDKNIKKLNFSYDENVSNFDNYNKLKNIKSKKDLIKMEYNNFTFNEKIGSEKDNNSKNLKFGYKTINRNDFRKTSDNYYSQKQITYLKDDNKYAKKENIIVNVNNFENKIESKNVINSQNKLKNDKDAKSIRKQILRNNYNNEIKILDEEATAASKPNYYFSYDYSTKIKNYDNKNITNSEYSTALDTAKYKHYPEEKNIEIKEFNVEDNNNNKIEYQNNKIIYTNNDYELNQKEQSYINNLKTLNTEITKENKKVNSIINKYMDKNTIDNNINDKKDFEKTLKYYNSTNDLMSPDLIDLTTKSNISSLLKKNYSNIKIVSAPLEDVDGNRPYKYENFVRTNSLENEQQNTKRTPQRKAIEMNPPNNNKVQVIQESYNLNTLESAVIRNMDEEEEIRTLELEKERKKLDELEKEKQRLIFEEKERRERIRMEMQRQEMEDIEKKKLMRKKYEERLKKKKEDEEKLMKIKEEQQRQLREINELKNNRKFDEQKLFMLTEGKLNRKQRTDYLLGMNNKNVNSNMNKLPFKINLIENNKENLINKIKTNNIDKNSKYWNYKTNIIENYENNSLNNSIYNDKNDDEESIIKDNKDFEEIDNNSEDQEENDYKSTNKLETFYENKKYQLDKKIQNIGIDRFNNNDENILIYKHKNKRININKNPLIKEKNSEYKTFSPKITHKANISLLSPKSELDHSSNKLITDLPDFSSKKIEKDENIEQDKENEYKIDLEIKEDKKENYNDSINKGYYEKKKFFFNKKQINKDKSFKTKYTDSKKGSFAKLNELREITSKLASEVEKKIQLINQNKLFSKSKSIPKLSETYSKYDYSKLNNNLETDNNVKDEPDLNKSKDKEEKDKIKKTYKYNQLIEDTKIEISNLINNNQNQATKKKSVSRDNTLPEEIKKECISEIKKIESFTKKKGKENILSNTEKVNKLLDNINRNKKSEIIKNYKTASNFNQKTFYNDYLYGNKKKIQGQEIDQKFLPYYKEMYGEATPEKDV